MDEFLRLLTEFLSTAEGGPSDDSQAVIDLATRWANRGQDGVEPLTDEELETLLDAIVALADEDEAAPALLTEAVEAAGGLRAEQSARVEAAEAEEAQAAAARAALRGETASDQGGDGDDGEGADGDGGDGGDEGAGDGGDGGDGDGGTTTGDDGDGGEGAEEGAGERQPVTAAGRPAARRRPRAPQSHRPQGLSADAPSRLRVLTTGEELPVARTSLATVDAALIDRAESFRGVRSRTEGAENIAVARIQAHYPEERRLDPMAPAHVNAARVQAVLEEFMAGGAQAPIVAAGGICAPPTPYYGVDVVGNARRPIRDSLPGFQAARGGIVSIAPPTLPAWPSDELIVWTLDDDVAALDPEDDTVKPCIRVECGSPTTTQIVALPLCLTFGNFGSRTFGENDRAWSTLAMIAEARFAEQFLLSRIDALSTVLGVTQPSQVSLALDVLARVRQLAAASRSRHRVEESYPYRTILPETLVPMIQEDLSYRMPGDSFDNLGVTRQMIERWLGNANIRVTWTPDDPTAGMFGAQGTGSMIDYPTNIPIRVFPEATFLHLDGGELDLGVVRDAELIRRNDFQTFAETFENVHRIGPEAFKFTQAACIRGSAMGLLDPDAFCADAS